MLNNSVIKDVMRRHYKRLKEELTSAEASIDNICVTSQLLELVTLANELGIYGIAEES